MKIRYAAASDLGQARKNNEDAFLADPALGIFAVADGMGGHAAGEVASSLAMDTLREFIARGTRVEASPKCPGQTTAPSPSNLLVKGIRLANQAIYQSSREKEEYEGMGTTIVAIYFSNSSSVVAHVGDSRLYHIRGQTIEQVTEDHSFVWEQYRQGFISKAALPSLPMKNIVTRALGMQPTVDVDVKELSLQMGDLLLLCSDGLTDLILDEELVGAVSASSGDLEQACRDLISLANRRGGKDNITVLLIHIEKVTD
ncbi:MAG TPA: Stp1/IreP family PP2C-type Ser/Thr phosphatase [Thermodesulfobacteriota bacterium]|nr:Stp1/IreP family PP2C-type Ser/Thr phosphatase [Thermodesulfobacteriota bacterium]